MRTKLTTTTSIGAAPWKFLLFAATLLFSYAIPAHADDHEEAGRGGVGTPCGSSKAARFE